MNFTNQPARIFIEEKGCTIVHTGSTYPPHKVSFLCRGTGEILDTIPQGKYHNVTINGIRDSKNERLTITDIKTAC